LPLVLVVRNQVNVNWLKQYYHNDKIFTPWFKGESHRIPCTNKNAVYSLQISALVPDISVFKKSVKYANEITDDVICSTNYYTISIDLILAKFASQTIETW